MVKFHHSAKAIAVVATHGGAAKDYTDTDKITGEVIPLIAIPTTAGTGSDCAAVHCIAEALGGKYDAPHG